MSGNWGPVLTELIPLALVVALSPLSIIPAVLVLHTAWPRPTGQAFLVGWLFGLAVLTAILVEVSGLAEEYDYELPMTQEQLADATGLTAVHVNRVLMALAKDGLIERHKRHIRIPEWEALRRVAGFSEVYLHLDQVPPRPRNRPILTGAPCPLPPLSLAGGTC
jgi:hypothetical protein